MKQKISGLKAIGNGTYNDSRKRTIYGDLKNSKAYIVDNNNKRLYTILSSKTFLAISIGLLVGYYLSWPIGVVVGVLLYIALELVFKLYFLSKLQVIDGVNFPEKSTLSKQIELKSDWNIVLLVITDISISVFLIVNAFKYIDLTKSFIENFSSTNITILIIASIGIIAFSLYMATVSSIVLYKRKTK